MATAKKKAPVKVKKKSSAKVKKKASAKKSAAKKSAAKKPAQGNVFRDAVNDALSELDQWVDTARLKAKQLAAEEKLIEKKAELAIRTEADRAKHLADQAEKWTRSRIKSDAKKLDAFERKLRSKLRQAERRLRAQAKKAEKRANKQGKALKKRIESEAKKAFGKTPARKKTAAKKKAAARKKSSTSKKKKAAGKAKPRAKR